MIWLRRGGKKLETVKTIMRKKVRKRGKERGKEKDERMNKDEGVGVRAKRGGKRHE